MTQELNVEKILVDAANLVDDTPDRQRLKEAYEGFMTLSDPRVGAGGPVLDGAFEELRDALEDVRK